MEVIYFNVLIYFYIVSPIFSFAQILIIYKINANLNLTNGVFLFNFLMVNLEFIKIINKSFLCVIFISFTYYFNAGRVLYVEIIVIFIHNGYI